MKALFAENTVDKFVDVVREGGTVACFGSRDTPERILDLMRMIGYYIAANGGVCSSGHAYGADMAFEEGACAADPNKMVVNLPWASYNSDCAIATANVRVLAGAGDERELVALASRYHGAWDRVSRGGRLLHGRNMLIAEGARYGVCYLNHKRPGFGGSGQCYRYLKDKGIPVVDLAQEDAASAWESFLESEGGNMGVNPREIVESARRNRDGANAPTEVRGDSVSAETVHDASRHEDEDDATESD